MEGAYQIATGALRSLSEQQLVDCSTRQGNIGCGGGDYELAAQYILTNGGLDSDEEYNYEAEDDTCWTAAEKRKVASADSFKAVAPDQEAQLLAAIAIVPVAVSVDATQPAFQHYKSGVFDDATCGADPKKLNHAPTAVGYTADAIIVKNSWSSSWGEQGFIRMKRGINAPHGCCGIAVDPLYAVKSKGAAAPIPPATPGHKPPLPCNCTRDCVNQCKQLGYICCGGGTGCDCQSPTDCQQCIVHPDATAYKECGGPTPACPVCVGGVQMCSPQCKPNPPNPHFPLCPAAPANVTAVPYCQFDLNGAPKPTNCALLCNVTGTKAGGWHQDGCPAKSKCSPANDPSIRLPCGQKGTCGICSYGRG